MDAGALVVLLVAGACLATDARESAESTLEVASGLPPVDLAPIAAGLVLVVLAALVRAGERLQRDTAGLV